MAACATEFEEEGVEEYALFTQDWSQKGPSVCSKGGEADKRAGVKVNIAVSCPGRVVNA